ncbi:molecular chaperone SurA [Pseudoluteimonas lycopersici]|uniref:Chaperone SurA n=1 Tax=Pseudoluteimonas lycopersici TaxID=1324796 RepID=A0A516V7X7_9GAMM|nr:molecular chaperone SurA [Lysobacter lycopersici]
MKTLLASLLAACLLAGNAFAQTVQPIDRIVAVVNDDVVLQSELDRAIQNIQNQYAKQPNAQLPPADVLRKQVLERLVMVRLQVMQASQQGIRVSDQDVDAAIAGVANQNHLSVDQLRANLGTEGLDYASFRDSIRDEIAIQRLRQRYAQTSISVSDAEVDAAMATQANSAQYHLAHLLVALPENPTPEQIDVAQKKIEGVKGLIDRGEMDFATAAARYSDSQNALEGGDLGWRSADEIPTAFANMISGMKAGQVIGPIRGASGFQLVQLVETRSAADAPAGAAQMVTQYQARHILVRVDDKTSDADAKARIDTLRARIAGGADFATVARENSDDLSTKPNGGDLGWFNADAFGPDFGAQVSGLQDGQVSQPFKTQAGWHIVQREGSRQVDATDENRRAQVRESIGQRKLEESWSRYLQQLRGEAYVDIHPADDGAASPNGG